MHLSDEQFENSDQGFQAPAKLVSALKRLPGEKVFVPRTVDESILKAARSQLRPAKTKARTWRQLVPWAIGATAAVVAGLVVPQIFQNTPEQRITVRPQDLNRDGVVDVLDAFALARNLESGQSLTEGGDLNKDGRTDHGDVAFLLAETVRLEKGGRL